MVYGKENKMTSINNGDFYEDEHGSIYEVVDVGINTIMMCRLRDNQTLVIDHARVRNWISNGALTVYLTADEVSS